MDWRNREFDESSVDSFTWEEKNLVKSRSDVNIPGIEDSNTCSRGTQESKSVTSALENLGLGARREDEWVKNPFPESKEDDNSPIGYKLERKRSFCGFRTHEISSLRLLIQGPEILNYQGTRHSPEDVAPYWKKDSRMWLWKSVRLARRKNKAKCSENHPSLNIHHERFKQK